MERCSEAGSTQSSPARQRTVKHCKACTLAVRPKITLPTNHANKNGRARVKHTARRARRTSAVPREPSRGLTQFSEGWTPLFAAKTSKMLRYSDNFSLTTTSGIVSSYVFAANGLFDPNVTGTGHQPMGFDQMMLSYEHFVVTKAMIQVTFRNVSSATTPTVAIRVEGALTPITSIQQILEFGLLTTATLEGKAVQGDNQTLRCKVDLRRFQGLNNLSDDPEQRGNINANPTELTYFHVQAWDTAGNTSSINCDVIMEFHAEFSEPRTLTQSLTRTLHSLVVAEAKHTA